MVRFSLLTLNSFGLPFFLGWRRLRLLARELNRRPWSVVCLQEVQQNAYLLPLIRRMEAYPFHAFEPFLYAPKGGLLTLSRVPIQHTEFTLYQDRGHWLSPAIADRALHKGILATHLRFGQRQIVVLNTHLTANYRGSWEPDNSYARIQREQVRQVVEVVKAQPADALVVACGDFNFPRGSWLYDELLATGGLVDPLAHDSRPTYRPLAGVPRRFALAIDFAFVRPPRWPGLTLSADLFASDSQPLSGGAPGILSDHYGVTLTVAWSDERL